MEWNGAALGGVVSINFLYALEYFNKNDNIICE